MVAGRRERSGRRRSARGPRGAGAPRSARYLTASKARSSSSTWPPPMRIARRAARRGRAELERPGEREVDLGRGAAAADAAELLLDRERQRARRARARAACASDRRWRGRRGASIVSPEASVDAGDRARLEPDARDLGAGADLGAGGARRGARAPRRAPAGRPPIASPPAHSRSSRLVVGARRPGAGPGARRPRARRAPRPGAASRTARSGSRRRTSAPRAPARAGRWRPSFQSAEAAPRELPAGRRPSPGVSGGGASASSAPTSGAIRSRKAR